jgi:hypothetical protein
MIQWHYEEKPQLGAVVIRLQWGRDGRPQATLLPPDGYADVREVAALANQPMDVPSAFAAGILLSLRGQVQLRITGDRSAWSPGWGTLKDVARGADQDVS